VTEELAFEIPSDSPPHSRSPLASSHAPTTHEEFARRLLCRCHVLGDQNVGVRRSDLSNQLRTGAIAGDFARNVGRDSARRMRFSASRREACRSAWRNSICVRKMASRRVFPRASGQVARAAAHRSTASSMLLQRHTITGNMPSSICMRVRRSSPSWPMSCLARS